MKKLWDSKQICEYLGWSYRYFIKVCHSDPSFPAHKIGGWRADPDELEAWFKNKPKGAAGADHKVPVIKSTNRNNNSAKRTNRRIPPPGGWQITIPQ